MRIIVLVMVLLASGSARADGNNAQIAIAIASSHDESPGDRNPAERDANRETIRQALLAQLKSSPGLTSVALRGIESRRVDLSVVALDVVEGAHGMELRAALRIVISDATGKILAVVTGGARAEMPRHTYGSRLRSLEKQLLEDAMQGLFGPLRTHLLRSVRAVS